MKTLKRKTKKCEGVGKIAIPRDEGHFYIWQYCPDCGRRWNNGSRPNHIGSMTIPNHMRSIEQCKHTVTQTVNQVLQCVECHKDVYKIETRECQHCKFFKDLGAYNIPICEKKLMGVSRTMHVMYKIESGTCFEELSK